MANQGRTQSRPLIFEDDPPADSRLRRVQAGASAKRRGLAGMPPEMMDDDEEPSRFGGPRLAARRFDTPSGPWWRPATTVGRVFLGVGALAVVSVLFAGYVVAKTYLGRDSRFRIAGSGNIETSGLTQVTRAEMLPVFGEDIGRNIFFIPLNERREQLEAIPWVQRATVMRLLPDKIRVSVVERTPVAFVRQGQQVGLVDADGVLLTMPASTMAQHHYSFPVVTGIDPHATLGDRRMRMAVYSRMLADLDSSGQHISQQISEIDLTDPQDARVSMPEEGKDVLAHFGDDKFLDRYQRYKTHIGEWRQQYPKITAVDLRYESQVVLEMTPGTSAVAATVGDGAGSSGINLVAATATAKSVVKPAAGTTRSVAGALKPATSTSETKANSIAALHEPSVKPAFVAEKAVKPPAANRPVLSDLVEQPTTASKTVANKPVPEKPLASVTLASASKSGPTQTLAAKGNTAKPAVKQVAVKQVLTTKSKASTKADPVEELAAKQRARREQAKAKFAHDKAVRDKKTTNKKQLAAGANSKKPATAATQGQ